MMAFSCISSQPLHVQWCQVNSSTLAKDGVFIPWKWENSTSHPSTQFLYIYQYNCLQLFPKLCPWSYWSQYSDTKETLKLQGVHLPLFLPQAHQLMPDWCFQVSQWDLLSWTSTWAESSGILRSYRSRPCPAFWLPLSVFPGRSSLVILWYTNLRLGVCSLGTSSETVLQQTLARKSRDKKCISSCP